MHFAFKFKIVDFATISIYGGRVPASWLQPHVVGAQLCRLSHVDARTVALKPVMGK